MTETELSTTTTTPQPKQKGLKLTLTFFIILTLLALGLSGFLGYDRYKNLLSEQKENSELSQAMQSMQQNFEEQKKSLLILQQNLANQEQENNTLKQQVDTLKQSSNHIQSEYTKAQVFYYLNQAQYQLAFEKNVSNAIYLLEFAKNEIATAQDSSLAPLNALLDKNIQKLKSLTPLDTANLLNQLNTVSSDLSEVFQDNISETSQGTKAIVKENAQDPWYKRWWAHVKNLKNLVVIQYHDAPNALPDQLALAQGQFQWTLAKAQWAILNHNETLYVDSLQEAMNILKNTFHNNSPRVAELIKALQNLMTVSVNPNYPPLELAIDNTVHAVSTESPVEPQPVEPEKNDNAQP